MIQASGISSYLGGIAIPCLNSFSILHDQGLPDFCYRAHLDGGTSVLAVKRRFCPDLALSVEHCQLHSRKSASSKEQRVEVVCLSCTIPAFGLLLSVLSRPELP